MNAFSLSPNPRLLYQTDNIKSSLHKLLYVVRERQGLTAILGEPGLGKSSLMRMLHMELTSEPQYEVAFIVNPNFTRDFAFLKAICSEFGISAKRSMLAQEAALQTRLVELMAENKNPVLLIDEAQRLSGSQLEVARTLLNFETNDQKLIQVVLAAQLELRDKLKDKLKKALRSRIFLPSILSPLTLTEAIEMIDYRCKQADVKNPFNRDFVKELFNESGGNPRELLKLCAAAFQMMELAGVSSLPVEAIPQLKQEASLMYD